MRHLLVLLCIMALLVALRSCKGPLELYQFPVFRYIPPIPEENNLPVTVKGAALGRYLFYDPVLSRDSSVSCGSCHRQEVAFSDAPARFSMGINGVPANRNTMPLFNLAWYPAMFWDGKAADIEQQVFHPVRRHDEMDLTWALAVERINNSRFYRKLFRDVYGDEPVDSTLIAHAIGQFERTLISYRSKYDRVMQGKEYFTADERKGFELMNDQTKGDCLHCHTTDADGLGTTARFSNNGLDNVATPDGFADAGHGGITGLDGDMGLFRIPTLRNVAITPPYMHDGRFATLDEVLDFYSNGVHACVNIDPVMRSARQGGVHLTDMEKQQIKAFLLTLTDSAFITDPAFSNPFY